MPEHLTTTATFLDGVLLVANAIPDLVVVVDSPDCGDGKVGRVGIRQDVHSTLNAPGLACRYQTTGLHYVDMTLGTGQKVLDRTRATLAALKPAAILVTAGSPIQLTGECHDLAIQQLRQEFSIPIFSIPSQSLSGDFLGGFEAALTALVSALPWNPKAQVQPGTVGIVGLPFERNEQDHLGNVRELERLFSAVGIRLIAPLPSGRPLADYRNLETAELLLGFPHGSGAAEALGAILGRPVLQAPLPVGIEATSQLINQVTQALGVSADPFVRAEQQRCALELRRVTRSTFVGKRALIAADPHLAQVLVPTLLELGIRPAGLLIRTRDPLLASRTEHLLIQNIPELIVSHDTPLPDLETLWEPLFAEGIDLVVGSTLERSIVSDQTVPYLELGFPSYVRHALFDAPWMGFQGALWLADRIYNLLSERRYLGP